MPQLFQTFKDRADAIGYPEVIEKYDKQYFEKINKQWIGIYRTVNEFDATQDEINELWKVKWKKVTKRNNEFLKKLKYIYADIDFAKEWDGQEQKDIDAKKDIITMELNLKMPPNIIINTKNWIQPLRAIDENKVDKETQEKYVNSINWIIQRSKQFWWAWDNVKDCARVLRVPWFYHMKSEPYLITVEKYHDNVYTIEQVQKEFPYTEDKKESITTTTKDTNKDDLSYQFREIEKIDIQDIAIKAFWAVWRTAEFDNQKRLILDWRLTWTHQWKTWDWQFIASSSHEPFEWNKITVVSQIMNTTYSEAYKWILDSFNIATESELKKINTPKIEPIKRKSWPQKFKDTWRIKFSTWNKIIDKDTWCFWSNELILLHGKSWWGKTTITTSIANMNWKSKEDGWYGNKVAFFSLEMNTEALKQQQAWVRAWIDRLSYQDENYTQEQRDEYSRHYESFDNYFTIFDENSLWVSSWITLEYLLLNIEKLHKEDLYNLFIIDSLKLIWWQQMKSNDWESKVITELRTIKNKYPICIVLIHHNQKWWWTFSWSQDLENFCDMRIEVKKCTDPYADNVTVFNKTKVSVLKERFWWKTKMYVFNYVNGNLEFDCYEEIEEEPQYNNQQQTKKESKSIYDIYQWRWESNF